MNGLSKVKGDEHYVVNNRDERRAASITVDLLSLDLFIFFRFF